VGSSVRRKIDTILSPPERPGEAPSAWQGTASTPRPGSGWPRYHHPCLDHSAPNCGPRPALGGREERAAPECPTPRWSLRRKPQFARTQDTWT